MNDTIEQGSFHPAVRSAGDAMTVRRWRFCVESFGDEAIYVDEAGKICADEDRFFIGTASQAADEAGRRADAYESYAENGLCLRITYVSHGKVTA